MNELIKEAVNVIMKELEETGTLSYTTAHRAVTKAVITSVSNALSKLKPS